jgi:putative ABC transport system permease protein
MSPARLFRRFAYWWRFRAQQDELREEMATHRELLAADLERRGLAPDAANAAARRAMGNETLMREEARGVWLAFGVESILKDWRYAWRSLRRSPAFTALVVTTMALTIAANTVVFSVVQHVLLAPLPFPDGNRIVRLGWESTSDPQVGQFGVSTDIFHRVSARSRTVEDFAGVTRQQYRIGDDPEERAVATASVTPSFLPMLRVHPAFGRGFTPDDARPGAPSVVMIGFPLWQARYAGSNDILGKVVNLDGTPRAIVGVMPNGFDIPLSLDETPEIWLPLTLDTLTTLNSAFARLRAGATSATASRELQAIARELRDTVSAHGYRLVATTARDRVDANDAHAIQLLFAAVCALLLIACANVANLLLMRGWTRRRELAIRLALGAGRARLARQLLSESILLAVFGGGIGLVIAWPGVHTLIAIYPGSLTMGTLGSLDGVAVDGTVLAWTAALSVATGLLFGVAPAFLAGDQSLGDVLRTGGRTVGSGAARRLRNVLIIAEIAVSLVFLAAAGLLVRSFIGLARTPIGYDPVGLAAVETTLPRQLPAPDRAATEAALIEAVRATPGVREAALGGLPQTNVQTGPFAVDGPAGPQVIDLAFCEMPFVSPNYFHVARIPLIQGRTFDATDPASVTGELVVNEALARRLWPGRSALGARLRVGDGPSARWLTVVGVAGDIHLPGTTGGLFNLQMYRPTGAASDVVSSLLVRVAGRASALEPALKQAVEGTGVSARFGRVLMADDIVARRVLARPRFALAVFGVFAAIALAVCAAGLYGIIAYAVSQRTREIGVRVALGAEPLAVARLVLADSGRLVLVGAALGLAVALAATRVLAGFLYQVRPADPTALGGAVGLLVVVALFATVVPVRRALRIDPMDALRTD